MNNPANPRLVVDYTFQRQALLSQYRQGLRDRDSVCDADPYLIRAAEFHGEKTERPCPICEDGTLTHLTYVFSDELGEYSGRIKSSRELPELAMSFGQLRVYLVEVCTSCGWNHLHLSYTIGDGQPRKPLRSAP